MNHDDDELKARVEDNEEDLLFYLRHYKELSSRGRYMKAVLDKEIERLEEEIKRRGKQS